jgi:hypothetical protein
VLLLNCGIDGNYKVCEMGGSVGCWKVGMYGGRRNMQMLRWENLKTRDERLIINRITKTAMGV